MKNKKIRILTTLFAATLLFASLCSLTACSEKSSDGITPNVSAPLPSDSKDKPGTVATYVRENQRVLNEIVNYLTGREGLSYFYLVTGENDAIYIDELVNKNNTLVRERVSDKSMEKLAMTGYVGEVTYNSASEHGIVSFHTYMSRDKNIYLFAYCPDEEAVSYLRDGYFQGTDSVSTTPIIDGWYYVEVQ